MVAKRGKLIDSLERFRQDVSVIGVGRTSSGAGLGWGFRLFADTVRVSLATSVAMVQPVSLKYEQVTTISHSGAPPCADMARVERREP